MADHEEIKKLFENDNLEYRHLLPKKRLTYNERRKLKEQRDIERAEIRSEKHELAKIRKKGAMKEYFQREKVKRKHHWRERIRLTAYKKLKRRYPKRYRIYVKMIKQKIYKKYGRVW